MKVIDRLKVYLRYPKYMIYDIKFCIKKHQDDFKYWLRKKLLNDILHSEIYSFQYNSKSWNKPFKAALLYPCSVVSMVLAEYFKRLDWLGIHGIDVNTQNEEGVFVVISLSRPGLLIGKEGKDINVIQNRLTEVFGRDTSISIQEVNDMNKNMLYIQSEGF